MSKFKIGDVVQLRSGGAPLTLTDKSRRRDWFRASCVSAGGLSQYVDGPSTAFKLYDGHATPPGKILKR